MDLFSNLGIVQDRPQLLTTCRSGGIYHSVSYSPFRFPERAFTASMESAFRFVFTTISKSVPVDLLMTLIRVLLAIYPHPKPIFQRLDQSIRNFAGSICLISPTDKGKSQLLRTQTSS
jgi:hypothetical protein